MRNIIKITDDSYVKTLGYGRHTITVQCSSSNTFPSRTLKTNTTFEVV